MSTIKTARSLTIAFLLAFLITAYPGGTQLADIDSPLTEAVPAYSASEVDTILKEVLPLVEELTARKLKDIPPIKLVTRKEYVTATMRDRRQQKETPSQPRQEAYVDYALGVYEPRSNVIFLLPGNFRPRLERAGVPQEYNLSILKMVVAHELTHALQHQEAQPFRSSSGRGRSDRRTPRSSPQVIRTITEGHATLVMDQVAARLEFPEAIPQFHKTISAGLVLYTDPKHKEENRKHRESERSVYLDGKRFIEWHYIRGGPEGVWKILKHPPRDWSVIEKTLKDSTSPQTVLHSSSRPLVSGTNHISTKPMTYINDITAPALA